MKFNIKMLSDERYEITIQQSDPTIRTIRRTIAEEIKRPWSQFIFVLIHENSFKIFVYIDSDPAESISSLLARNGFSGPLPEELNVIIRLNLSPSYELSSKVVFK
jgi:hypothetical protein